MSTERPLRPEESGVVQALEARDLTIADTLGKYRLLGALGTGGMADVYLAVAGGPEGFRKLCVLKLLKESMAEDEEYRAMFLDEARLAARLNHPNIVQTFEVGETHGRLMIAMEYIEGQPATRVRRRLAPSQLPLEVSIALLCDVLDALEYAHGLADYDGSRLGIVHRDVSPHNIIVGYDGRVKLVDFGIAKSSAAMQETQAGVLKGKVGYMAPEQASMRDVDGRADLFSVGVVLWEAIAGRRLSEGMSSNDVLMRRVEGNDPKIVEVVPDVDPHLAAICDRAMARDPDDRFGTAAELQLELEAWLKVHGEPSRKELSKVLKEAFVTERAQLRSLVEQRLGDAHLSGMRPSLGLSVPPSGRLPSTVEPSIPPPHALPQLQGLAPPPSARPPQSLPPPHAAPPPSTISLAPPPRNRALPGLVIMAVAASVVVGVGATIYVTQSSPFAAPAFPASPEVGPHPAPSDSARVPPPSESVSAATAVTNLPTATSAPARTGRPAIGAPVGNRAPTIPAHAPAPVVTTPSSAAASVKPPAPAAPTPAKPASRPLDEKDPYAP